MVNFFAEIFTTTQFKRRFFGRAFNNSWIIQGMCYESMVIWSSSQSDFSSCTDIWEKTATRNEYSCKWNFNKFYQLKNHKFSIKKASIVIICVRISLNRTKDVTISLKVWKTFERTYRNCICQISIQRTTLDQRIHFIAL